MKPAHYDINLIPGQRYDDEFIFPTDLTGLQIDFLLNSIVYKSTKDGSLTVTVNHPSVGESTISPVFTTDETMLMKPSNTYRITSYDGQSIKELIFYGNLTLLDIL